jgi:hypothetical protein
VSTRSAKLDPSELREWKRRKYANASRRFYFLATSLSVSTLFIFFFAFSQLSGTFLDGYPAVNLISQITGVLWTKKYIDDVLLDPLFRLDQTANYWEMLSWSVFAGSVTVTTLTSFFLGRLSFFLTHKADALSQKAREIDATILLATISSGCGAEFGLFLRAFYTLNISYVERDLWRRLSGDSPVGLAAWITEKLEAGLNKKAPLIALGARGETVGAARILLSEEVWQQYAALLMEQASVIYCCPSRHVGTQWELNYLIDNKLLHKTVFIIPSRKNWNMTSVFTAADSVIEDVYHFVEGLRKTGYHIPDLNQSNSAFLFLDDNAKTGRLFMVNELQMQMAWKSGKVAAKRCLLLIFMWCIIMGGVILFF